MKFRFFIWDAANERFFGTNSSAIAATWAKETGCAVVDADAGIVMGIGESKARIEDAPCRKRAFDIGDTVSWSSQAGGHAKKKVGVVVAIVAAGQYPSREDFPSLHRSAGVGMHRDHPSYVVRVKGAGLYWPRAKTLNLATQAAE